MSVTSVSDSHDNVTESRGLAVEPEFLRLDATAVILGLSEREIYRLVETGELAVHYYKRRTLVDPASVRELAQRIRNGEFAPDAETPAAVAA